MSNLKDVNFHVHSVSNHELRSAVIKFLKSTTVSLESRKKLMRLLKNYKPPAESFEVFSGVVISKTIIDIVVAKELYLGISMAVEIIENEGITTRSEYRLRMIEEFKEWSYPFSTSDLKNTRVWAAIDSLALMAGYQAVNARYAKDSGITGFYKKFKRLDLFKNFTTEEMSTVANKSINKVERYIKENHAS